MIKYNVQTPADLNKLDWMQFQKDGCRPKNDFFLHCLKIAGALWIHSNNGLADETIRKLSNIPPHAGLSAGGCSTGFLDTLQGLSYTRFAMLCAWEHSMRIREAYDGPIDWVIGSDHAAATYSAYLAYHLGARHDFTVKIPAVKDPNTGKILKEEEQVWNRFQIGADEVVFRGEELSTTGNTPDRVTVGVEKAHTYPINWAPVNAFAVNRTGQSTYRDHPIIDLFKLDYRVWSSPAEYPLCAAGSKRITKPKENWLELTT